MASKVIKMLSKKNLSTDEIIESLKEDINGELVTVIEHKIGDISSSLLVFEKYYFRNGSYTNLTIMITEGEDEIYADIVGSGGGEGILNISWGANSNFAEIAERELKTLGFEIIE